VPQLAEANNRPPLRHVRESTLVLLLDGVLSLGTRHAVFLREHQVLVSAQNWRPVVTDTVEAVYKPGCERLVEEPRHTA